MLSLKTIKRMTAAAIARYPEKRAEWEARLADELARRAGAKQRARLRALGRAAGKFLAAADDAGKKSA